MGLFLGRLIEPNVTQDSVSDPGARRRAWSRSTEFKRARALVIGALAALASPLHAQAAESIPQQPLSAFEQNLLQARGDLLIENGKFSGSAAAVLERAVATAQYVLVGEDHYTREIPEFTAGLCDVMAAQGLSAMAMETGPQAADFVSVSLANSDRLARMTSLMQRYPLSVAFLNSQQEIDLAAHCARVAGTPRFHLWGLDQEFVGSMGWLLDLIIATHPGPAAAALLERLQHDERQGVVEAKATGDTGKLLLLTASQSQLNAVAAALRREGNKRANALFGELRESHEIYRQSIQGLPDANSQRARLLKQNFARDMAAADAISKSQKVLVKFGDWHLYKGFNPLHQRDLGNYIAELADAQGRSSLHICILGAKGTHLLLDGYGRTKLEKFVLDEDKDYRWIKPMIDHQVQNAWTLYDLRKLRFQPNETIDPNMEHLIYGYDVLIVVPEVTPADILG